MDGLGPNRSIKGGTPSETRLKVIHREALELALYTFRYLPDAESVMVLLPPPPPTKEEQQAAALAAAAGSSAADEKPLTAIFYRPATSGSSCRCRWATRWRRRRRARRTTPARRPATVETLTLSNRFNVSSTTTGVLLDRASP